VKPYHEAVDDGVYDYTHVPIMGWSEMATQALYHAGGIGHLTQKVHTVEHNTKSGRHPMLVVNLDRQVKSPVANIDRDNVKVLHPATADATKIGMMDFLTNNNDRHPWNMLYHHEVHPDWDAVVNRVLAIDNGRAFQYKHANRWQRQSTTQDHLHYYLRDSPGMRQINIGKNNDYQKTYGHEHLFNALSWWEKSGPQITAEFDNQLKSITNPRVRDFIHRNFYSRASALDRLAREYKAHTNPDDFSPYASEIEHHRVKAGQVKMLRFKPPAPYNKPPAGWDEEEV
jgi:hypothetical protein